jgi:hypothetical protein
MASQMCEIPRVAGYCRYTGLKRVPQHACVILVMMELWDVSVSWPCLATHSCWSHYVMLTGHSSEKHFTGFIYQISPNKKTFALLVNPATLSMSLSRLGLPRTAYSVYLRPQSICYTPSVKLSSSLTGKICMLRLRLGCSPLHIFMHMMCKFVVGTTDLHIICIKMWRGQQPNPKLNIQICPVHKLGRKWTKNRPVREIGKSRGQ